MFVRFVTISFPPPTRAAASGLRLSATVAAVGQHQREFSVREYTPVDNIGLCVHYYECALVSARVV